MRKREDINWTYNSPDMTHLGLSFELQNKHLSQICCKSLDIPIRIMENEKWGAHFGLGFIKKKLHINCKVIKYKRLPTFSK